MILKPNKLDLRLSTVFLGQAPCEKICSGNLQMSNLHTEEIVYFHNLRKIGTDKNIKAIYSSGLKLNLFIVQSFSNLCV